MQNFSYTTLALFATLFTWSLTALGAVSVVFFKNVNKNWMDGMLGFAGGVMIAASFWSLLSPAIDMAESLVRGVHKVVSQAVRQAESF